MGQLLQTCLFVLFLSHSAKCTLIQLQMDLCGEESVWGFGVNANAVVLVIQGCVPGHLINYCTAVMKYWNAHAQYQSYRKSILL